MENNKNNKNDKRNSLLGLLLVAGVVFYIWKTRKPKAYAIESGETESGGGGGGGGFMGGGMPLIITTPVAAPAPAPAPAQPSCREGELYDTKQKRCVSIAVITAKEAPQEALREAYEKAKQNPVSAFEPYDPCKTNGYGGTYDAATNSCKKSPACGGGDLLLDSNGKMKGCKADIPTGSGTGGVVGGTVIGGNVGGSTGGTGSSQPTLVKPTSGTTCPTGYKYMPLLRMCMKIDDSVQFSGKMPLTLDNLLC